MRVLRIVVRFRSFYIEVPLHRDTWSYDHHQVFKTVHGNPHSVFVVGGPIDGVAMQAIWGGQRDSKTRQEKIKGVGRVEERKRVKSSLECGTAGDEKEWEFAAGRGNWREAADY